MGAFEIYKIGALITGLIFMLAVIWLFSNDDIGLHEILDKYSGKMGPAAMLMLAAIANMILWPFIASYLFVKVASRLLPR